MKQTFVLALGVWLLLSTGREVVAENAVEAPIAQQVAMPDAETIVLLVRNSLITLSNAVQTGNFTVLRDVAAPGFREANSSAKLSHIFANLTAQKVDLAAVAVTAPQLTQTPTLDQAKGLLHLKGYFPGQPVQINFELLYQAVNGSWRLFGVSVQPGNAQGVAPAAETPQESVKK
jgi:type IV secretory pathway VirJ component